MIIGNPPYNANQLNENDNNKNREYPAIDQRIRATYIKASNARKTKLYDMYVRFFRWASDRIAENGVVAFVSNSSFIHKPSFDGFRKIVASKFNEIRIVDLKGDARSAGETRRREGGNVFGNQIRVGIAVYFCTKKRNVSECRIWYGAIRDYAKADEKRDFISGRRAKDLQSRELIPSSDGYWIALGENEFSDFVPITTEGTKAARIAARERAIFKLFSLGVSTNRDEWLYDFSRKVLTEKMSFFITHYNLISPTTEMTLERR